MKATLGDNLLEGPYEMLIEEGGSWEWLANLPDDNVKWIRSGGRTAYPPPGDRSEP